MERKKDALHIGFQILKIIKVVKAVVVEQNSVHINK